MAATEEKRAAAEKRPAAVDDDLPQVERCTLACALLSDKAAALLALRGVRPDWFFSTRSRVVAAAILDALAAGRPVEAGALATQLEGEGRAWAPGFIESLLDAQVLPSHAEFYVDKLAEAHFRSETIAACTEATRELDEGKCRPEDAVARLSERVARLLRDRSAAREPSPYHLRVEEVQVWHKAREDVAAGRPARSHGLSWGICGLDAISEGMYPGLHIVAARPSFGKTMLENWISCFHLKRGARVARACLDMTPRALALRALTLLSGESLAKFRSGYMTPSDEAKVRAAAEASRLWHERILTETTAEAIASHARALKAAEGLDLLTVDYIQLVGTAEQSRYMNDNMAISRAMKALKAFANETETPVLLLSQLSRAVEQENRAPQLSDLRDSGSIEQEAKTVTFVYPEPTVMARWMADTGVADWKALPVRPGVLHMMKNQDGGTGAVGVRQHAKYGIYEEAKRLTRDDLTRIRIERDRAALESETKHRRVSAAVPQGVAMGYDFGEAGNAPYVVAWSPKGALEVFALADLPILNAAAQRLGEPGWEAKEQVNGLVPALERLQDWKAARRAGSDAAPPQRATADADEDDYDD